MTVNYGAAVTFEGAAETPLPEIKYCRFRSESNVSLSPAHAAAQKSSCFLFNPKQGLRMRQMSLQIDRRNVGAYLYRCDIQVAGDC
jgi:hypothetical protein